MWRGRRGPRGAGDGAQRATPGRREAQRGSPPHRSSHRVGTQALGGAFPVDRNSRPRGDACGAPIPRFPAAPPRGERARCTGVAQAPGTVSISGGTASLPRSLPQAGPPCLPACTAPPPPWATEPRPLEGRDGARLGAGPAFLRPRGRQPSQVTRRSALGHLAGEVFRGSTNFPESWRPGGGEGADWPLPAPRRALAAIGWGGGGAGRDPPPGKSSEVKWCTWKGRTLRQEPPPAGCSGSCRQETRVS